MREMKEGHLKMGGRHSLRTTSLYKEFNNFDDMNFFTWLKNEI